MEEPIGRRRTAPPARCAGPRGGWARPLLLALAGCLLAAGPAHAVLFTQQIERLQAVYAALLDYRPGAPPFPSVKGELEVALDVLPIPPIDNRVGSKDEPVHPPAAIPRPRARAGLGGGAMLGALLIPPVEVQGYQADLQGVEAGYAVAHGAVAAGLRAFYLAGTVRGPISDPGSRDKFTLASAGADLRVGWSWRPWTLYAGAGSARNDTSLTIASDGSRSTFGRQVAYGLAGVGWRSGPWRLTVEQEQTEDYLSHVLLEISRAF